MMAEYSIMFSGHIVNGQWRRHIDVVQGINQLALPYGLWIVSVHPHI
jgi:hypothetical protein